ncbi:hypothetical protein ACOJQI_12475 [Bacillus salacetis]|uniref:hypothetical protein n=1 Tax=Bacillus salacetis TaxID=2315464 RepID=UPI003BA0A1D7
MNRGDLVAAHEGGKVINKIIFATIVSLFVLSGCSKPEPAEEVTVYQVGEDGEKKEAHTITDPKDIEYLEEEFENERWSSSGVDLYVGTDYSFELNREKYDVHIHERDNSIEVFRIPSEGGTERAYILYEQAEGFFEVITGESLTGE